MGNVKRIFVKTAHGEPMTEVETATAISGKGIEGDASFGRRYRQVLLIDIETLNSFGVNPGEVKENITLEGFKLSDISPSDVLTIGGTMLVVTGPCEPCSMLDAIKPGLSKDIQGKRGVLAKVVRGGELRIDDPVALAQAEGASEYKLS